MIPEPLITTFKSVNHVVILTGAGVSAESGIPTFRDALTGLWQNHDPAKLASKPGFLENPALVWGWYEWRRYQVLRAQPNPAHLAIAQLAQRLPKLTLITQNVDNLHERAGSEQVLHLHGSLHNPRCVSCGALYSSHKADSLPTGIAEGCLMEPPLCDLCGAYIRPGVVWFGESLPPQTWTQAMVATTTCDLMLVIGTSGLVWPAADLPHTAAKLRIPVVQINPDITSLDDIAKFNLHGKAGDILPQLLTAAFEN